MGVKPKQGSGFNISQATTLGDINVVMFLTRESNIFDVNMRGYLYVSEGHEPGVWQWRTLAKDPFLVSQRPGIDQTEVYNFCRLNISLKFIDAYPKIFL